MREETDNPGHHIVDDIGVLDPYARAFTTSGVAYPSDLALLKAVYDRICAEQGLPAGCPEAAQLAGKAMQLFSRGIYNEDILCRELRRDRPVARPSGYTAK